MPRRANDLQIAAPMPPDAPVTSILLMDRILQSQRRENDYSTVKLPADVRPVWQAPHYPREIR